MKMIRNDEAVGATIIEVPTWGPITVLTEDGRTLEIRIEEGHSGPEHNVYEGTQMKGYPEEGEYVHRKDEPSWKPNRETP